MKIFPAIDLKDGQCVRLRQGDFDRKEIFSDQPEAVARKWEQAGAEIIHVVDLDGALTGSPANRETIHKILKKVSIPLQVGGGIRDFETVKDYLAMGISRVVLGTSVVRNIELLKKSVNAFPEKIVAGIDAKKGKIAVKGWIDLTSESALDYARKISEMGIAALVYTDIEKDGMMEGPNFIRIQEMAVSIRVPLIVSGGVTTLEDIRRILLMENIEGIIIGRALYSGALSLESAIVLTRGGAC